MYNTMSKLMPAFCLSREHKTNNDNLLYKNKHQVQFVEMRKIIAERERLGQEKLTEESVTLADERRAKFYEDYMYMRKLRKELHWRQLNQIREKRKDDVDLVETGLPKFPVILKADVDGSLEVLEEILAGFHSEHVELSIVSSGVGDVNEGDYTLAQSVGGRGEVLKMFVVTDAEHGKTTVAGCRCQSGMFKKDCLYRIIRNNEVVYEGNLTSMRKLKISCYNSE